MVQRKILVVRVGTKEVGALVDPGSEVSLIKKSVLEGVVMEVVDVEVRGVGGGGCLIVGAVEQMVVFDGEGIGLRLLVVTSDVKWSGYDVILGADWCHAVGLCMEFVDGKVEVMMMASERLRRCRTGFEVMLTEVNLRESDQLDARREFEILEEFKKKYKCLQGGSLSEPAKVEPVVLRRKLDQELKSSRRIIRQGPVLQLKLKEMIDGLVKCNVLKQVLSSWVTSPAFLVPKAGRKDAYRLVIDYRLVNNLLMNTEYPLPLIDELLNSLKGATMFSIIDLEDSYWQLPLEKESRYLTDMSTPFGTFRWNRLPQGIKAGPNEQQRVAEELVEGITEAHALMDDIIVATSASWEEHCGALERVFRRLDERGFRVKLSKIKLFRSAVRYVGLRVSRDGISIDGDRVESIKRIPVPKKKKDVRSLLGFFSFFRRFIPNFTEKVDLLQLLVPKGVEFVWKEEHQEALEKLKNELVNSVTLSFPDYSREFVVTTDASDIGVGAVLSQDGRPVAYFSKRLSGSQKRWSTTDKELYAVLASLERFRTYLCYPFKLITDHRNLIYLFEKKVDDRARYGRWLDKLSSYSFTVEHAEGRNIPHADYLSRHPVFECSALEISRDLVLPIFNQQELVRRQKNLKELEVEWKRIGSIWHKYCGDDRGWIPVIDKPELKEVVSWHKSMSHFGETKLYNRLSDLVWWRGMRADIVQVVKSCDFCQKWRARSGRQMSHGKMQETLYSGVFRELQMDILGPVEDGLNGYRFIVSVVDMFSKFLVAWPMKKIESSGVVAQLVKNVLFKYGVPWIIRSDNGPQFVSKLCADICRVFGINHQRSSYYHPESQGIVERLNQYLAKGLSAVISQGRKWSEMDVALMCYVYNTTSVRATGFSPFFIMFGRKPEQSNFENLADVEGAVRVQFELVSKLRKKALKMLLETAKKRVASSERKELSFKVGELVWICRVGKRGLHKLSRQEQWEEGIVIRIVSEVAFEVRYDKRDQKETVHASRLMKRIELARKQELVEEKLEVREREELIDTESSEIGEASSYVDIAGLEEDQVQDIGEPVHEVVVPQLEQEEVPRQSSRVRRSPKPYWINN